MAALKKRALTKAIDKHGLPWGYPIELRVHVKEGCKEILAHSTGSC